MYFDNDFLPFWNKFIDNEETKKKETKYIIGGQMSSGTFQINNNQLTLYHNNTIDNYTLYSKEHLTILVRQKRN